MVQKKGLNRRVAMSAFKQESAGGVAVYDTNLDNTLDANASEMQGYEFSKEWNHVVVNDKEDITGFEHGTTAEVVSKATKIVYKESKAKPHTLALLAGAALGSISSASNVTTGYTHSITPVANTSDIPSIQIDEYLAGVRREYNGMKINSLKISCASPEALMVEAEFMGSGTITTEASTTWPAKISESWLFAHHATAYLESGASISIATPHAQGTQSISSGTPDDYSIILKAFEFTRNNNLEGNYGFGSQTLQELEHKKRENVLSLTLQFSDTAELDYFVNQTELAFEIDFVGASFGTAETLSYGFKLVIPSMRLAAAPVPDGGVADFLTCTFDCQIFSPSSGSEVYMTVVNNTTDYLQLIA